MARQQTDQERTSQMAGDEGRQQLRRDLSDRARGQAAMGAGAAPTAAGNIRAHQRADQQGG